MVCQDCFLPKCVVDIAKRQTWWPQARLPDRKNSARQKHTEQKRQQQLGCSTSLEYNGKLCTTANLTSTYL